MTDLGTLGGGLSIANAINPAGQVVGYSQTASERDRAFLWKKGVMTDLGARRGTIFARSYARDINPAGQVVGWSQTAIEMNHAFLWEKGVWTDLGTLGGTGSSASDINPAGQVVGVARRRAESSTPFSGRRA